MFESTEIAGYYLFEKFRYKHHSNMFTSNTRENQRKSRNFQSAECVSISSSLITFQTMARTVSKRRKISIMAPAFWIMAFNNVSRVFHNSARLVLIRGGSFRSADNSAMHHSFHISSIGQHRVLSFEKEWPRSLSASLRTVENTRRGQKIKARDNVLGNCSWNELTFFLPFFSSCDRCIVFLARKY